MTSNLKDLITEGIAFPALLPVKNDFILNDAGRRYKESGKSIPEKLEERLGLVDLRKLDSLDGYTVPFIAHDYGAKTSLMWNTLYEKLGLNIRNIMLVADPNNLGVIAKALRSDQKYLGGGFGVGFKEKGLAFLDEVVPEDLSAINLVVKQKDRLVGYNTDSEGFVRSLEEELAKLGKKVSGGTFVILGAGGVAKEVSRTLAKRGAGKLRILNRTERKSVELAYQINTEYSGTGAIGAGEDITRGFLLNSYFPPDAVINLTDKGADGPLVEFAAFHNTNDGGDNISTSRTIARELRRLNPNIIIADIVLPKSGRSITLRVAENEGLKYLLDGKPMVIYQAAPAYVLVQNASPELHKTKVNEEEALKVFGGAVL